VTRTTRLQKPAQPHSDRKNSRRYLAVSSSAKNVPTVSADSSPVADVLVKLEREEI